MSAWRNGLLVAVVTGSTLGWLWMFLVADHQLRGSLSLLLVTFLGGTAAALWHYRERITPNLLTSWFALGTLVHAGLAALVVAGDRLGDLGLVPALASNGHHFLLGVLGLAGAALSWTRARGRRELPTPPSGPVPVPPASPEQLDWDHLSGALHRDPARQQQLAVLRAIAEAPTVDAAHALAQGAAQDLALSMAADAREASEDDALSQAASLLEWGAQKLPELAEIDVSDLLMAKVIADIRAQHDAVERRFVPHQELRPIHPIDRDTANDKCNQRADAARDAWPLLEQHGLRLSEDLIAAHEALAPFRSVTGFQVVSMGPGKGYVTFEGNGRREALQRAFGDRTIEVEVRLYTFRDPEVEATIQRRVERVRRWKGVSDDA